MIRTDGLRPVKVCALICLVLVGLGTGLWNALPAGSAIGGEVAPNVVQAQNRFGANLFKTISRGKVANVVISPTSLFLALAMTRNGAASQTREQMTQGLSLSGVSDKLIDSSNSALIKNLTETNGKVTLEIANAIYLRDKLAFEDSFVTANKAAYQAEMARVAFGESSAVDAINSWVSGKTHGKIPTIVSDLNEMTACVLLNAVYFKGLWLEQFEKRSTREQTFTQADDSEAQIKMMHKNGEMSYLAGVDFQAVRLPYKGGAYSLYVFLPDPGVNTWSVMSKIGTPSWEAQYKKFAKKEGTLVLPKVKIEFEKELKNGLRTLGMRLPFDKDSADFARMTKEPVYIDQVIHKTFLDINEEGTEAAAATAVVMQTKGLFMQQQPRFSMICDHPYIVVLRDDRYGCELFLGVINKVE